MSYDKIEEVQKFNPYHDARGRFATADSYTSFTYKPGKSKAHDLAIQREKDRQAAAANSGTRIDGVDIADKLPEPRKAYGELPKLTGTEKQVEWAEKIRGDAYDHLSSQLVGRYHTAENYQHIADAMQSKEKMAEYVRSSKLVQTTSGSVRQEKIDRECAALQEFSRRESAFVDIMSHDSAKWWIDNRPNQVENANYKKFDSMLDGTYKPPASSGSKSASSGSSGGGSSGKLVIPRGGKLPSDLSGIDRISGDTYANKEKIKAAGFKWDSQSKTWVRPGVAKSAATLLDDEPAPYDYITEVGDTL